jgi:hypothetical protein
MYEKLVNYKPSPNPKGRLNTCIKRRLCVESAPTGLRNDSAILLKELGTYVVMQL